MSKYHEALKMLRDWSANKVENNGWWHCEPDVDPREVEVQFSRLWRTSLILRRRWQLPRRRRRGPVLLMYPTR
jgi:hypothetical protein